MSAELMNTKEVAEYLDVHEKQVYILIKAGRIPCTRVTGKWIFPVKLIDEWIETDARDGLKQARKKVDRISGALLASGSNDPILDLLLTAIKKNHPDFDIFSANTGSISGLQALNSGLTDIAFSHLYDSETGDYNIPYLSKYLPEAHPVVVNLFSRRLGFVYQKEKYDIVDGFASLTDKKIRFINRQQGSGTRLFLDDQLKNKGITAEEITGYDNEVYTHFEVGLAINAGEADMGIASAAVAKILGLNFLPLIQERFDMILDKNTFFQPALQAFIETLKSIPFRNRVEKIGDYDLQDTGRILYS